jgi:hypothetical protein
MLILKMAETVVQMVIQTLVDAMMTPRAIVRQIEARQVAMQPCH